MENQSFACLNSCIYDDKCSKLIFVCTLQFTKIAACEVVIENLQIDKPHYYYQFDIYHDNPYTDTRTSTHANLICFTFNFENTAIKVVLFCSFFLFYYYYRSSMYFLLTGGGGQPLLFNVQKCMNHN